MKLNKEEKEILEAYEKQELKSIPRVRRAMTEYREYAKSALNKNKRINIRLSERDILHMKMTAVKEGLPYQTLISSILHKYLSGSLRETSR